MHTLQTTLYRFLGPVLVPIILAALERHEELSQARSDQRWAEAINGKNTSSTS